MRYSVYDGGNFSLRPISVLLSNALRKLVQLGDTNFFAFQHLAILLSAHGSVCRMPNNATKTPRRETHYVKHYQ